LSTVGTFRDDGFSMQQPFDAAIVIATIMRPSLGPALRSIFQQSFRGRTQIVLGIDKSVGERDFCLLKLARGMTQLRLDRIPVIVREPSGRFHLPTQSWHCQFGRPGAAPRPAETAAQADVETAYHAGCGRLQTDVEAV
jgi:hypothetical protein